MTYTEVITTDLGHLDGIAYIAKAGADIASVPGAKRHGKAAGLEDIDQDGEPADPTQGRSRCHPHAAEHGYAFETYQEIP